MNIILFDNDRDNYYPLSFTRPISFFRVGILTIKQKWEQYYNSVSIKTIDYLSEKYPLNITNDNMWVDASIIPSNELIKELDNLRLGEGLVRKGKLIVFRSSKFDFNNINRIESHAEFNQINYLWDIFTINGQEIKNDFKLMFQSKLRPGWQGPNIDLDKIKETNINIGENPVYVEEGAKLQQCILNTTNGPIYIGKNAEIMEGSIVRGPFAMLDNSVLKIGAKIYEATTLGPYCKVGGEVNNTVFFGYSSKAHDGFIGNSVIGEWCNLGADTNTSNLKNNYEDVKLWNYQTKSFNKTGLQFLGIIMGDHSKCAINTMFNTGTLVGVSANIFGSGFSRNFIPSFSWGGSSGFSIYNLLKAYDTAKKVFSRRNCVFNDQDEAIFEHIFNLTKSFRKQFN